MKSDSHDARAASRRGFLAAAGGLAAASAHLGFGAVVPAIAPAGASSAQPSAPSATEPFWGEHQGGILTPSQTHTYFAAFDLTVTKRAEVVALLRDWTTAADRMSRGQTAQPPAEEPNEPAPDSGEAIGLPPARLTLTFGFGPGLFMKDKHDRFGLAGRRPAALIDLPVFNGDQLVEAQTGGDLSVQACADDPQVAFHAVRQLSRIAYGAAKVRWAQTGFLPTVTPGQTPRNLMGFKDGTNNPSPSNPQAMDQFIWAGAEAPDWMRGGSYLVARRIRMALEHWDRMKVDFQGQVFGRHKYSGAPLTGKSEYDPLNLDAADKDGNPIIPDTAHVRLAAAATNNGAQIFRRPYSYNDGVNFTSERWPPWRQGMEYDAGLFFLCYQRDPRTGFVALFDNMSKLDMLNQFVTHVGGGLFACPGGVARGEYVGRRLFEPA